MFCGGGSIAEVLENDRFAPAAVAYKNQQRALVCFTADKIEFEILKKSFVLLKQARLFIKYIFLAVQPHNNLFSMF